MSYLKNMRLASALAVVAGVVAFLGVGSSAGAQLEPHSRYQMAALSRFYAGVLEQQASKKSEVAPTVNGVADPQTSPSSYSGIPSDWWPTALCEEGGRDDPYAGYFGILEWQGFGGYATAGAAPLSVQLGWEAAHGQGPPDAPGQCHSY